MRPINPSNLDSDDAVLLEEVYPNIKMDDLRIAMEYISALQNASLNDKDIGLGEASIHRLRNPPTEIPHLDNNLQTAIKLYLGLPNADRDYNTTRAIFMESKTITEFPTLFQVKEAINVLTGVEAVVHDMCACSCMAFTGPYVDFNHCTECGESRWDPDILRDTQGAVKTPRRQFSTILLGSQLQAAFRDLVKAKEMRYRQRYTGTILEKLKTNGGQKDVYNDFFDGTDYLEAAMANNITDDDILVMFSINGAQLYRNKASDCWMSIWVIFDHSPDTRYKKEHTLPGIVIPGPNKPKNIDSFLFPGFHHVAMIMKEGLLKYDAAQCKWCTLNLFIAIGTSDGPCHIPKLS
ncbi:hypothetical protein BS17DRAFT_467106 [Gyrodon lividus]|nr:hypothetical protein BS17DRAFT_467106 [Gyrodon lividus]